MKFVELKNLRDEAKKKRDITKKQNAPMQQNLNAVETELKELDAAMKQQVGIWILEKVERGLIPLPLGAKKRSFTIMYYEQQNCTTF